MEKNQKDNPLKKLPEELARLNKDLKAAFDTFNNSLKKAHERNLKNTKIQKDIANRLGIPIQARLPSCSDCKDETDFLVNGRCHVCHNYLQMIRLYPER